MKSIFLLLWMMFVVVSGLAQTPSPSAPVAASTVEVSLKEFTSRIIGFSASMPAPVRERAEKGMIENGAAYRFDYRSTSGGITFIVTVTFLSSNLATPEQIKKRFREALEKVKTNQTYKWLNGGDYILEGNPGVEYKIEIPAEDSIVWSRQYFAFGKIYETSVHFPRIQSELKTATAFMDSLKILRSIYTIENLPPILFEQAQNSGQTPANIAWVEGVEKVSGQVLATNAVKKVFPKIPKAGVRGIVQMLLVVSEEGKLVSATAVSGEEALKQVCLEAINMWVFHPILVNGKPSKVQGTLAFKFGE